MVKIYFLNVGHGDCTIIEHESGNITMIDINNGQELDDESASEISKALGYEPEQIYNTAYQFNETPYQILKRAGYKRELENPIHYLKNVLGKNRIFRYVQTHPDLDHMRGISHLKKAGITIINFWDTEHTKDPEEFYLEGDEEDWSEYQSLGKGENGITVLRMERNATGQFFNYHPDNDTDGDGLYLLAPTKELSESANSAEKWNNLSYVLLFKYHGYKVILGGDAEEEVWESILEAHKDELACNVLKASHHGRDSGFHEESVKLMNPEYTIVSVGKKPETDASNKYKKHTKKEVWSTRWKGNIILEIADDGTAVIKSQYDSE